MSWYFYAVIVEPTCATAFGYFPVSENYSRRTVQTQCNMFLWNYLNGKLEESGKSDLFSLPVPMPPSRKTVWTQCSIYNPAALEDENQTQEGKCVLKSGEITKKKKIIQEAIRVLKLPQYHMLSYKVIYHNYSNLWNNNGIVRSRFWIICWY